MAIIESTENMLTNPDKIVMSVFIDSNLSTAYRGSMSNEAMLEHLDEIRSAVTGAGSLDIALENNELRLIFSEGTEVTVVLQLSEDEPGMIDSIDLEQKSSEDGPSLNQQWDAALRQRIRALESLSQVTDEGELLHFAGNHLTDSLRKSISPKALISMLLEIGRASAGSGEVTVSLDDHGVNLSFRGSENIDVHFTLEGKEPFRLNTLSVMTDINEFSESNGISLSPITWDNLHERLREEERAGFSGVILIVHEGQTILHEGYGFVNREQNIPNTTETTFCIGSTPIDFTRAAILKLQDDGKLHLSDPISMFFQNVPTDKVSITLEHLMTGHSGLPNFHHDPENDEDYDLTWIDREEAIRRILGIPLLFKPGEDQSHSHSAFVLLAAIIEIVSGESYPDYLKKHFFNPIGMQHTGFYGADSGLDPNKMAVGYGTSRVGKINIPYYWGPTSWLIMGSGGMVSNPEDMLRWVQTIHGRSLLSEQALEIYGKGSILAGGSDRGFLFIYIDDPENSLFLSSNAHTRQGDLPSSLALELIQLMIPEHH
ncbi:beta-lactamase family protein [bacterium]|nr:beta-lactamase family protein [bacterium]